MNRTCLLVCFLLCCQWTCAQQDLYSRAKRIAFLIEPDYRIEINNCKNGTLKQLSFSFTIHDSIVFMVNRDTAGKMASYSDLIYLYVLREDTSLITGTELKFYSTSHSLLLEHTTTGKGFVKASGLDTRRRLDLISEVLPFDNFLSLLLPYSGPGMVCWGQLHSADWFHHPDRRLLDRYADALAEVLFDMVCARNKQSCPLIYLTFYDCENWPDRACSFDTRNDLR